MVHGTEAQAGTASAAADEATGSGSRVARYFADVTWLYRRYGKSDGFHYGIWEPDVRTHVQALVRSNELLVRDLPLTPRTRVLDVGCGIGTFAAWCAKERGCRVTGVNSCEEQVRLARELVRKRGVADRCDFAVMDLNHLTYPPGSFDVVVNQESACYATHKPTYFEQIYRLLTPGGCWSAVEFSRQDEELSPSEHAEYQKVLDGFLIPDLHTGAQFRRVLAEAGFVDSSVVDVTALTHETCRYIIRHCHLPMMLMRLRLDWIFFGREAVTRRNHHGHHIAGVAYSRGLLGGYFRHYHCRGTKPG